MRLSTACFLALSCLSLTSGASWAQTTPPGDYFDPKNRQLMVNLKRFHLDLAHDFFAHRKLDQAQSEVNFILKYAPNHPEALLLNEGIAKSRNLPEAALIRYIQALKAYPQHAITHEQFGAYLLDLGRVDAAVDSLSAAIQLNPRLGVAHAYLAKAYRVKGDLERAAAEEAEARKDGFPGPPDDVQAR